jgi:hypothetical protein
MNNSSSIAKCRSFPLNNSYNLLFVDDIINPINSITDTLPNKNITFINSSRKTLRSSIR